MFTWDKYSDQPNILNKSQKQHLRTKYGTNFYKLISSLFLLIYFFMKYIFMKKTCLQNDLKVLDNDFYGICVNLDKGPKQVEFINELNVKSLQIRFFLNDIKNIKKYVDFAKSFGDDKNFLITIVQNREHIQDSELLKKNITIVFKSFSKLSCEFQIGNAINRIKWEFVSIDEYLKFFQTIQKIRDEKFPKLILIGSSIIDFEYHFTIRTLFNNYNIHYDKLSSLLYVDRRGDPTNKQYKIFSLKEKIDFLHLIVKQSKKCNHNIYITEVNWPLKNTAPYAPTSEIECVNENDYSKYMLKYFKIAKQTNKISRVYWHQLIAPGYGLIDNRNGMHRKTKAFNDFKLMIRTNS